MRVSPSWIKSLVTILLAVLAVGWEIAIRPFLPPFFNIPLFLPYLVILLIGGTRFRGYLATIVGALCLQLYVFGGHDLLFLRWIFVFFILDVLARRLLTNHSFYVTLALGSLAYFLERLTSFVCGTLLWRIGLSPYSWELGPGLMAGFVWNVFFVGTGFLLLAAFTRRFSPSIGRGIRRFSEGV